MPTVQSNHRHQAIVLGGSIAGLLAARVLSAHFDRVTIVEKDPVRRQPESRPGQPQTRQLHALLATGLKIMTDYFPDLPQALVASGAVMNDFAERMQWYCYGGYRQPFNIGFSSTTASRELLEHLIRERVLDLPQVELIDRVTVKELMTTADRQRVIGVAGLRQLEEPQIVSLSADLVIDATGRNSRSPQWLQQLGYEPAPETKVHVDVCYATRTYRRDPHNKNWLMCTPEAPKQHRFGGMFPIEGDRWLVLLGGWHGDLVPTDEVGFLEYARGLPSLDIYDRISQSEPRSEIVPFKFPCSQRRHYERLRHFPSSYLVLGDAACSFNPTYGQGMTVAALEAAALDRILAENIHPDRLAATFFQRVAKIVDIPWQMAVAEDFRYPQTTGIKPTGIDLLNRYVSLVHRATLRDRVVGAAFLRAINLMEPPTSLFAPRILWRVLTNSFPI